MKKLAGVLLAVVILTTSVADVFGEGEVSSSGSAQLVSQETVRVMPTDPRSRNDEIQTFTVNTFNDNGVIVYAVGKLDDDKLRDLAFDHIISLADSTPTSRIVAGQHSIIAAEGQARQAGWVRNTHNTSDWRTFNQFSGAHGVAWDGAGQARDMFMTQRASFTTLNPSVSITWPPSFNISLGSLSREWRSDRFNANSISASVGNVVACNFCLTSTWAMEGQMIVGTNTFRPGTTVSFGLFN